MKKTSFLLYPVYQTCKVSVVIKIMIKLDVMRRSGEVKWFTYSLQELCQLRGTLLITFRRPLDCRIVHFYLKCQRG